MAFPKKILIREVGLREGFQIHPQVIATKDKLRLITLLNSSGVSEIELTALVRPDRVPQMADADQLIANYDRQPGVRYTALSLNTKALIRAITSKRLDNQGWLYFSVSETFFKKNNNLTFQQFLDGLGEWAKLFDLHGLRLTGLMVSNVFGCGYEGRITQETVLEKIKTVIDTLRQFGLAPDEIALADTTGMANPITLDSIIKKIRAVHVNQRISLHLHDTYGLGLLNAYAGLEQGVDIFECSLGGVGGCPFSLGSAGNIATEDFVYLCEQLGIETGINLDKYCEIVAELEQLVGSTAMHGRCYKQASSRKNNRPPLF